jgi:primosomal protein N' (replication factor Y)
MSESMSEPAAQTPRYAQVIVDVPVAQPLDYRIPPGAQIEVGALIVVPVGRRRQVGIVIGTSATSSLAESRLRDLGPPASALRLSPPWLELSRFAAGYYHVHWGELALPALPPALRRLASPRRARAKAAEAPAAAAAATEPQLPPPLRAEQQSAIDAIATAAGFAPFLLFGVTGSGKTEVYLGAIARLLDAAAPAPAAVAPARRALPAAADADPHYPAAAAGDADRQRPVAAPGDANPGGRAAAIPAPPQILLLVPEINLTPQLHARLSQRFPLHRVVSLHSSLPPAERAAAWMAAHDGRAQIILGTRTAIFASLPRLALIVVDEEHDASFKAQGGVPFSARDLAVKRAQLEAVPVVLGSATPSLESWHLAQSGRYRLLTLAQRAGAGGLDPEIETIDLQRDPSDNGLAAPLRDALQASLERGEQSLVFINRRGFAPVLRCGACEWLSKCPNCDTFAAYHKVGAALRCHHCGWHTRVPGACPDCGNQDLQGVGQGTQRVEETLRRLWPDARIARIDRDNTQGARGASRAGAAFDAVHAGEVDILVGTQMITKGHDFRRVTTVGVLNADAQLVAADFRAPERLFAVLMQVAGRAGRAGQASRVLIQTRYPHHPLFAALSRQSFEAFAEEQIDERRAARMPPFVYQALLTAAARTLEQAIDFLRRCRELQAGLPQADAVTLFDAVPMPLARLASESRGQLLIEAGRRRDLHDFLDAWLPLLREMGNRGVLRWGIEVDPQAI